MSTYSIVEAWEREQEAKGEVKGFIKALLLAYEDRFGELPADLRVILQQMRDDATLRAWDKLVLHGTADAFAEAVRQGQAA